MKGRKTGGRQADTPNRRTLEVQALAQRHGEKALAELARLAMCAESERVSVAACRELLDRAYGRAPQSITGDPDCPIVHEVRVEFVVVDPVEAAAAAETRK